MSSGDLWIPVVNTGEHAEEGAACYDVEVRDYEISVMKVQVERGVTQPDTC